MFGYIVIGKPELKFKEYDIYRGYYCGLCRSLKKQFSQSARLSLNYDLTFLGLMLSSLYEPETTAHLERCALHPLKKQIKYENECIDYASQMSIVLSYLKCEDDWLDEKKISRRLYGQLLKNDYNQIEGEMPDKIKQIEVALQKMQALEKEEQPNLDALVNLFGQVMGLVFSYRQDEWQSDLYAFGEALGKFIYLLDAYDDLEKDIEAKRFNPLIERSKQPEFEENCHHLLEMMIAKASEIFEYLPIVENADIIRNILYNGVWSRYLIRHQQRKEKS